MEITKKFTFEGSHVVRNCTSHRCSHSVHGHSYVVELTFSGRKLDNAQMLYDFGLMKGTIKEFIDSLDHCHVISEFDSEDYIKFFTTHNDRWIIVPFNPSAEMLSVFIMRFVQFIMEHTKTANGEDNDLKVKSVTVHETATGRATCDEEDVRNLWNDLWIMQVGFSKGVMKDWSKGLKGIFFSTDDGGAHLPATVTNPTVKQQINLPKAHFVM